MEEQIIVQGALESKQRVLTHVNFYNDVPLVILRVRKEYFAGLMNWAKTHDIKELEITIREKQKDITERAKRFFFTLRDRIAKHQGDTSRENKDNLYRSAVKELDLWKKGHIISSLKDLDKRGMFMATEVLHRYAIESEAYIGDLIPDYTEIQKGLKE